MKLPRMYTEFASWWPLISSPQDYAEEAHYYQKLLKKSCRFTPRTMLELGSGGGNNASHLKAVFEITMVDRSAEMLSVSKKLNPECEHLLGDMRSLRLGRTFDAVLIHDAVVYMTSEHDLAQAVETAFVHCNPGGAALFCPDQVRDTFKPGTSHGGHDLDSRGLRYLEWVHPPSGNNTHHYVDYVYLLRESDGSMRTAYDRHTCGLFSRRTWMSILEKTSFKAESYNDPHGYEVFVGKKGQEIDSDLKQEDMKM